MIRMEQEEFFIEPVERGAEVIEDEEQEGGGGRAHIVYRSSAVKKRPISSAAADFHSRGQSAHTLPASPPDSPHVRNWATFHRPASHKLTSASPWPLTHLVLAELQRRWMPAPVYSAVKKITPTLIQRYPPVTALSFHWRSDIWRHACLTGEAAHPVSFIELHAALVALT